MKIDIETLISCVEKQPCLWDKTHKYYKDRSRTHASWREIFLVLKGNYDLLPEKERLFFGREVIKRWNNIRDSFRKHLNKKEKGLLSASNKKYVYQEHLQFLHHIFLDEIKQSKDPRCVQSEESSSGDLDEPSSSNEFIAFANNTQPKKKRKLDEIKLSEEENPHMSFFRSILPCIRDFNEEETLDLQMGVLQLIKSMRNKSSIPLLPFLSTLVPPPNHYRSFMEQLSRSGSFSSFLPDVQSSKFQEAESTVMQSQYLHQEPSSSAASPEESKAFVENDFN